MQKFGYGLSCFVFALSLSMFACGDDSPEDDNAVEVDAPGVDVSVEELSAPAGSGASAPVHSAER